MIGWLSFDVIAHLWQSTLVIGVVWLLTLALRGNRALVRHRLWLAASVKFLVPFSWFVSLGAQLEWRTAPSIAQPAVTFVMDEILAPPVIAAVASTPTANPTSAWPWLLGPFIEAWVRVRGSTDHAKREAHGRFIEPLEQHRSQAGLGHVSEIADAQAPHTPRGCPFQAWSIGELLRLEQLLAVDRDRGHRRTNRVVAVTS